MEDKKIYRNNWWRYCSSERTEEKGKGLEKRERPKKFSSEEKMEKGTGSRIS